jgi:hypothetical protein
MCTMTYKYTITSAVHDMNMLQASLNGALTAKATLQSEEITQV